MSEMVGRTESILKELGAWSAQYMSAAIIMILITMIVITRRLS